MTSSKPGFVRKSGTVITGVALLGSLMLTACGAPAANNADSKSQPSASATASEAPQGNTEFKSDAFDLSKQVSINAPAQDREILLPNGVVSREHTDSSHTSIAYVPYENKDGAWKYTSEVPTGENAHVRLMRWKDKSYIVIDGYENSTQPASGLQAEKKTTAQNVIVLDVVTGKTVNVLKGEPEEVTGKSSGTNFYFSSPAAETSDGIKTYVPFLTGLTYNSPDGKSAKLVDPLTGKTLATNSRDAGPVPLNNESGFYKDESNALGRTTTKAVFGNFAFVANPDTNGTKSGYTSDASVFTLVNTVTNETVSTMKCLGTGIIEKNDIAYSPDFRYVVFAKEYAFDTKTGKSFCSSPTGKTDARDFQISAVDNNGLLYGAAGDDYLRVDLADNTKVETLLTGTARTSKLPFLISTKGSAVFYSEKSEDVLVVVPAKNPTLD